MRLISAFVAVFAVGIALTLVLIALGNYNNSVPSVKNSEQIVLANPEQTATLQSFAQNKEFPAVPFNERLVSAKPLTDNNLTEEVAAEVSKDILARNPDGPAEFEEKKWINVVEPEKISAAILNETLTKVNREDFEPSVDLAKIKVLKTSEPAVAIAYLKAFRDILNHNFQSVKIDFAGPELNGLVNFINAYNQTIADFYALEVPESLAKIHQQEIVLLLTQKRIFEALQNYETDPARALLAGQLLEQVNEQFAQLNLAIGYFVDAHKLSL